VCIVCACAGATIVPRIGCIRLVVPHAAGAAGVVSDTRMLFRGLFGLVFYVAAGLPLASRILLRQGFGG
jgi:hypothetical protein